MPVESIDGFLTFLGFDRHSGFLLFFYCRASLFFLLLNNGVRTVLRVTHITQRTVQPYLLLNHSLEVTYPLLENQSLFE
jgi:hypothetical protein